MSRERALVRKNFRLAAGKTSIALEPAFWALLAQEAEDSALTLGELVERILDSQPSAGVNRASALRLHAAGAGQESEE